MPEILVVDDAETDRAIVKQVLTSCPEWNVEYAAGAAQALTLLQTRHFDLVLTDPNGLELLKLLRQNDCRIPVVIMTDQGSEDLAIQALRNGAANYIVRKNLAAELPAVISQALVTAHAGERESRMLQHLQDLHYEFVLPNDAEVLRATIPFLQDVVRRVCGLKAAELTLLGIGLEEALCNAMIHGNLEVSSALREQDIAAYERLIEQRLQETPFRDRSIFLWLQITGDRLTCRIRDQGPGFDVTSIPDPTDPQYLSRPCGRGLLLIRSFLDEVRHNERGNEITMSKLLGKGSATSGC